MKKHLLYLLPALLLAFTSCSDDDEEVIITVSLNQTELAYGQDGVWQDVSTNNAFQSQNLVFSHEGEIGQWGLLWNGFTPARVSTTDKQADWLANQFQIMTGGGVEDKGTPYIVAFWDTQENEDTPLEDRSCRITYQKTTTSSPAPFTPYYVFVQNTAYAYYTMLEGNAFTQPFTEDSYLKLIAHGVKADGSETSTDFMLADGGNYANDWVKFDLSPLGEVTAIYFTMEGSDTGQWGLNTPSYFALDKLRVRALLF